MRILFVTENLSERPGANVNIVLALVKYLKDNNEVFALSKFDESKQIDTSKRALFSDVFSFFCEESGYVLSLQKKYRWSKLSSVKKALLLLTHPKLALYMWDIKRRDSRYSERAYVKAIERVCSEHPFDMVVGVSAPYYIARALSAARIGCAKALFQLDPYTYNYALPPSATSHRRATERRVLDGMDKVLAVSFVYDEMKETVLLDDMSKAVSFRLPCIKADAHIEQSGAKVRADSSEGDVHFVFAGQFYKDIRNPEFLLRLFCALPDRYKLHVFGGGAEQIVDAYKHMLGDRLILHGWVSADEAQRQIAGADILVNLNNSIRNQMPSKLIEYISTGKPILNVCKFDTCLSLACAANYSNCISIIENDVVEESLVSRVCEFVEGHKHTLVDRETILADFVEYTDQYVASLIERHLQAEQDGGEAYIGAC